MDGVSVPRRPPARVFAWVALAAVVLAVLFLGASWGFPNQSDVYLVRLLKAGGPDLVSREHPDRPVYGLLLAAAARLTGDRPAVYIALALVGWAIFASEAVW